MTMLEERPSLCGECPLKRVDGSYTNPHDVVEAVAVLFGVTEADLRSQSRSRRLTRARHVSMYLTRRLTSASYPTIAELFDRDHTTVMSAVRHVEALLGEEASTSEDTARLALWIGATT